MLFISSCGQEKKQSEPISIKINTAYPEVNAKNFEQKLLESVKHYEKEPIYYLRINKINCLIEILIKTSTYYAGNKLPEVKNRKIIYY
ncbi:hypothetical protein EV144_102562 [Flavobacterium sp. 270]|nr:hypothetical protein EV144_102562 [Flavobacterium sp. 270]